MQDNIWIGDVEVPAILEDGVRWYPISFITTKLLKRSSKNSVLTPKLKKEHSEQTRKYVIDFGEKNIQETNCVSEEFLRELLSRTQVGRLSIDQKRSQNHLHRYLGMDLLNEREIIIDKMTIELLKEHDYYTEDVIKEDIKRNGYDKFQLCSTCNKYYPLESKYFLIDDRNKHGFGKICRLCSGTIEQFKHVDKDREVLFKVGGEKILKNINDDALIKVYNAYLNGDIKKLPTIYQNKNDYTKLIKYIISEYKPKIDELTITYFIDNYRLNGLTKFMDTNEMLTILFGDEVKYKTWIYKTYKVGREGHTYEEAKIIFDDYLQIHIIEIDDIFTFKYGKIITDARIRLKNLLEFVVWYHNYKYAGYLFNVTGVNYYKHEDNLLFDLRYLIENDLKLDIDKIPLYLTKNALHTKCSTLYNYIVTNKHGSLFEWIDKLYPNKFIEADFEINPYRNEFDSDTERLIHDILVDKFGGNVMYNPKHSDRTIKIDGMIPDWFLFRDSSCWIIEYFGMYVINNNDRNERYVDKTNRKLDRYKNNVKGYKFLYLYPEDIEDDFKGCREKIDKIE